MSCDAPERNPDTAASQAVRDCYKAARTKYLANCAACVGDPTCEAAAKAQYTADCNACDLLDDPPSGG